MQSFITINGTKFPQPRRGLELLSATIVDSARNANGVVVGQKSAEINRSSTTSFGAI